MCLPARFRKTDAIALWKRVPDKFHRTPNQKNNQKYSSNRKNQNKNTRKKYKNLFIKLHLKTFESVVFHVARKKTNESNFTSQHKMHNVQ